MRQLVYLVFAYHLYLINTKTYCEASYSEQEDIDYPGSEYDEQDYTNELSQEENGFDKGVLRRRCGNNWDCSKKKRKFKLKIYKKYCKCSCDKCSLPKTCCEDYCGKDCSNDIQSQSQSGLVILPFPYPVVMPPISGYQEPLTPTTSSPVTQSTTPIMVKNKPEKYIERSGDILYVDSGFRDMTRRDHTRQRFALVPIRDQLMADSLTPEIRTVREY